MTDGSEKKSVSYFLAEAFGRQRAFPIEAEVYEKLDEALSFSLAALDVEDVFQVFAKAFVRFEKDLLEISLEYAHSAYDFSLAPRTFLDDARSRFDPAPVSPDT